MTNIFDSFVQNEEVRENTTLQGDIGTYQRKRTEMVLGYLVHGRW